MLQITYWIDQIDNEGKDDTYLTVNASNTQNDLNFSDGILEAFLKCNVCIPIKISMKFHRWSLGRWFFIPVFVMDVITYLCWD